MTLRYDSTLADTTEAAVRHYLRSRAYATNRWRGALVCAAMFAAFAFLGFNAKENVNLPVICAAAAAWGAGLFLLAYKGSIRRRIAKYVATEVKGPWPRAITYAVADGKLSCEHPDHTLTFSLADLTAVTESNGYLQLSFNGNAGLCVIPLRAFDDTAQKTAFLAAVGRS